MPPLTYRLQYQLEDLSNTFDTAQEGTRDLLKLTSEELADQMAEIPLEPAATEPESTPKELSVNIAQPWRESEKLLEMAQRHYKSINEENAGFTGSGPDVRNGEKRRLETVYSRKLEVYREAVEKLNHSLLTISPLLDEEFGTSPASERVNYQETIESPWPEIKLEYDQNQV